MSGNNPLTLVNPQNGNLAFRIYCFEDNGYFDHIQRLNYYSVILVSRGSGRLKADFSEYELQEKSLLFFSPYQPFMISTQESIKGVVLNFHPDFFCIHKHQKEVACNGVLFNNIYESPLLSVTENDESVLNGLVQQMQAEMQNPALAQYELLVSYLKIFLIHASRLKVSQQPVQEGQLPKEPFILQNLKDAIEEHYRSKHAPSDYATMLNISPKALGKITKTHFNKTLSDLIAERIVIEAKRELYLTSKPVKSIAYELGFDDEYYFSRFFKKNAEVSPQIYRETVGAARSEVANI